MTNGEKFWYAVGNVLTFGRLYFRKITIKKAILESRTTDVL